jgi:hypothetical protein
VRIGNGLAAVLVGAGAMLMMLGAADAATLDAQAVNAAQFSAPSGKGKGRARAGASAPSPATTIKTEILLDRAGFSPGQIDGKRK